MGQRFRDGRGRLLFQPPAGSANAAHQAGSGSAFRRRAPGAYRNAEGRDRAHRATSDRHCWPHRARGRTVQNSLEADGGRRALGVNRATNRNLCSDCPHEQANIQSTRQLSGGHGATVNAQFRSRTKQPCITPRRGVSAATNMRRWSICSSPSSTTPTPASDDRLRSTATTQGD